MKRGIILNTWHDNDLPSSEYNSVIWSVERLSDTKIQNEMGREMEKLFGLSEAIDQVYHSPGYVELFSFGSGDCNIYNLDKMVLSRFMYYFKEQAKDLIIQAEHERIPIPLRKPPQNLQITEEKKLQFSKSTKIKRYYLRGLYQGLYLTNREVESLTWTVLGKSSDEIAKLLYISKRTVERYNG